MGKSSLRVRTRSRLEAQGYQCASIDLTRLGSEHLTPTQWYRGLIYELWSGFGLKCRVPLSAWFKQLEDMPPVQQLSRFVEEVLLVEIPNHIVIFIDEIDSIKSLDFSTDDFFAWIRSCYNYQASGHPASQPYQRLTFALFGVATPSELIEDRERTPFNIGTAIHLSGFSLEESQSLAEGFAERVDQPQEVLAEILKWTGGQPFLTQKLCQILLHVCDRPICRTQRPTTASRQQSSPFLDQLVGEALAHHSNVAVKVAALIQTQLIDDWEAQDHPEHFKTIRNRLLRDPQRARLILNLYQRIVQRGQIRAEDSPEQTELLLSGLVSKQGQQLQVANPIYAAIFDQHWLQRELTQLRVEAQWSLTPAPSQTNRLPKRLERLEQVLTQKPSLDQTLELEPDRTQALDPICAAFVQQLDELSQAQVVALAYAIAQHSAAQAQVLLAQLTTILPPNSTPPPE
jgi:hypothetical protein